MYKHSDITLFSAGNVYRAISATIMDALRYGVGVKLQQSSMVDIGDGVLCSGAFDSGSATTLPCIYVAVDKPILEWLPILLHEASHMEQCAQDRECWKKLKDGFEVDADQMFFEWIAGERECDADTLNSMAMAIAAVELDCEKTTVRKIYQFNLDTLIDVDEYIQKSNSYVMFYTYIAKTGIRKFYNPDKVPYKMPEIWSKFPRTFIEDITNLTDEYKTLYDSIMD
jgi:hypothetical protein